MTNSIATQSSETAAVRARHQPSEAHLRKLIDSRSYAVIATVSPAGHPHAAGVLYQFVDDTLFVNTLAASRKSRNIEASGRVGVTIPVRRVPVGGPPSAIQFQANARVLTPDNSRVAALAAEGRIDAITSHGELELEGSRFLAIDLPRTVHTYGIGMSLLSLIRHPLDAGGVVDIGAKA